ncbi:MULTISPECIES: hypothetical protein [unclassified Curtobacterium]|uniref:hypothetical protein n=1 Tax=unclassified Curtobacterium TaxID=257496 RepID=UPI00380A3945
MPEPQGPEPTGWELMRRLDSLSLEISSIGNKVVSQAAYDSDKRGLDERLHRIEGEIDGFHTKTAERDKSEAAQRGENERFRKNMNLSIALAVASPIIAFIVTFLTTRGGA